MTGPNRRSDFLAVALLVLLPTLFFGDVLLGLGNFYMRDLTRYYYPTKQIYREVALGGELPLWNRYFHGGQPIAANPEHEIFYPFTWLILLPSYDLGYRLHILVHIYIGLLGMYALLRSMSLRPASAFFGAVSFGLGGVYLSYINLLPILFCAAWLPLTCLFVRRFLLRPTLRDYALASLSLGMQFLVAEPTTVMQTGFIIGMYGLYRGWYGNRDHPPGGVVELPGKTGDELRVTTDESGREAPAVDDAAVTPHPSPLSSGGSVVAVEPRRSIGARLAGMLKNTVWIALISASAFAVGAVQMLAAIDHVGDSARARTFEWTLVKAWSMPWAKFAELVYPNILGHISVDRVMWYWAGGVYPGMGSPFLFSIYAGLAVTTLAVAGAFSRQRGARFVLTLCIFSSVIALGANTVVLRFLYDAGIATSIRYPEKFFLIAAFSIILFAAMTLERILAGDRATRDTAAGFALATTVVAAVIAALAFTPLYAEGFSKIWCLTAGANANRMISLSRIDWIVATARGAILVLLLLTVATRFRKTWLTAAFVFVCADLGPVMHELNPRMPARFFTARPEILSTLRPNQRDYRVFHEADWYGGDAIARKYFSTGKAVYWVVRNGLFPMTPVGHGVRTVIERDYDKTALLPTIDFTESVWDLKRSGKAEWWQPFMAMSNAWYRAVYKDFEEEKKRISGDFTKAVAIRFIEGEHHPRYYFADQVVDIADRQDFVKKLFQSSYSNRVAFVQRPSFVPPGEAIDVQSEGRVHSVRETANTAVLDVETNGQAFLVMSVTPHKYWRVTLDGKDIQPVVTNIGYQGVVVPAGRHRIEMRYRNDMIAIGAPISASAAGILLAIVIFTRKRSSRAG